MRSIEISRAVSIDKPHGRFLMVGAEILSKFATSQSHLEYFLMRAKLQNLNLFQERQEIPLRQFKCDITVSLDSDLVTRLICVSFFLTDKIIKGFYGGFTNWN